MEGLGALPSDPAVQQRLSRHPGNAVWFQGLGQGRLGIRVQGSGFREVYGFRVPMLNPNPGLIAEPPPDPKPSTGPSANGRLGRNVSVQGSYKRGRFEGRGF